MAAIVFIRIKVIILWPNFSTIEGHGLQKVFRSILETIAIFPLFLRSIRETEAIGRDVRRHTLRCLSLHKTRARIITKNKELSRKNKVGRIIPIGVSGRTNEVKNVMGFYKANYITNKKIINVFRLIIRAVILGVLFRNINNVVYFFGDARFYIYGNELLCRTVHRERIYNVDFWAAQKRAERRFSTTLYVFPCKGKALIFIRLKTMKPKILRNIFLGEEGVITQKEDGHIAGG